MPRIHLWTGPDPIPVSFAFAQPDGSGAELTNERLWCNVFAGRDPKDHLAVVDTGAAGTIFPHVIWKRFQSQIEWLTFSSGSSMRRGTIAGKEYHFRLGRIALRLSGRNVEPILPPVIVVAQFEQFDPSKGEKDRLTYPIVGLQFGPLENRYLVVSPNQTPLERCVAWVSDERPVDPLVLTSATL